MDLLREFFRHNTTMNQRLLEACRSLSAEQLAFAVPGTYGGIGATLVHIANSQMGYARQFFGTERIEPLSQDPFPGFDALEERFAAGNARLEAAAADIGDHEIQVRGDDPPGTWRMAAALLLLQAVNHGTEHRSQVATILTQLGIEPPAMDGWTYFFASDQMIPV